MHDTLFYIVTNDKPLRGAFNPSGETIPTSQKRTKQVNRRHFMVLSSETYHVQNLAKIDGNHSKTDAPTIGA